MGPRGAATASVSLKVTGGTPSVYVPVVFDAEENSQVLKPHTTHEGAWKAAGAKCAGDKGLYRFEVWEMELVIDGPGPLAPPPPGDPAVSAYLARRATCRRCGEPGLVPCPAVLGLWLSDRQGTGRGLCPDGEMHQAENITEAAQAAGTEG